MNPDARVVEMMSYYRDAELHGANLLLRLMKLMDDGDAQVKLALPLAEETHHAWLWTKRISDMGAAPVRVEGGEERATAALEKYREIDREVYGQLEGSEREAFGEAVDPSAAR